MSNGKARMYALVRNGKTGMPSVSDPRTVPNEVWESFTLEEQEHVNNSVSEEKRRLITKA